MCTEHGRMLIAATLCCRGPKVEAAAATVATADDKEFAKELYRNLVDEKKALLAISLSKEKQLVGGQVAFPPPPPVQPATLHRVPPAAMQPSTLPRCTAYCP